MIKPNDVYGIYTVQKELEEKDKYRHKLYEIKCNVCNKILIRPANKFASPSAIIKKCQHLSKEESENISLEK